MFLVTVFGIIFNISKTEWFVCILLFGGVIALEIMNTAIETTVDLITMEKINVFLKFYIKNFPISL